MTAPPTWRDLGRRARRLGASISYLNIGRVELARFASWTSPRADSIILRTAVAAALQQPEARR